MKYLSFVRVYPLSTLCVLLIWVLSLTPFFPETPLDNVDFIDVPFYGGSNCATGVRRPVVRVVQGLADRICER